MFKSRPFHRARRESDEPACVARRSECLREAGFACKLADRFARDDRYELSALLDLVARGCPPELAGRILAPLDRVL